MVQPGHVFGAFPFDVSASDLLDQDTPVQDAVSDDAGPICIACGVRQSADGFLPCGHDTI
ncbi:hypothetical protein [Caballeronia sp. LZ043]|uniref:hypothetical protein n=1 Tax=Caballeronia sp. LZ043 TaxID=3038569 RepID=UPI002858E4EA|nr:hypothetical protein [Caballeronia sp. LZ043]MDR5825969.1 hypothetical protein [Caballeronia sp. LZ043]